MKETCSIECRDFQIDDVAIINQKNTAGFLDVDDELWVLVTGYNGGHARFRVIFLRIHSHAPRGYDFFRLQARTIHDDELWRPVGAGDGVLVLIALVFRGFHRASFQTDFDFGDAVRLGHPQVDKVNLSVPANCVHITARIGWP